MITETERLLIRRITVDDAAFVLRLVTEPSFISNIGDKGLTSLQDVEQFIAEGSWTNQELPGYGQFLVELKDDGTLVGICGLLYRERLDVTDVGFAFLPEYWRCGFATEAADAMQKYGQSTLGIKQVVGLTSQDNLGSINVLEKLGMHFEKVVKLSEDDPGTALYS